MPPPTDDDYRRIDSAMSALQQGDFILSPPFNFVHLASCATPLTEVAQQDASTLAHARDDSLIIETTDAGFAVLTQTCDIVRSCRHRPFLELAPLVPAGGTLIEETRRLKHPGLAYLPGAVSHGLIVNLDRTLTVEKAVLANLAPLRGLTTDKEITRFAAALAAKRSRFAFPADFAAACQALQRRLQKRAGNTTNPEGRHVDALDEIRVHAEPSWASSVIDLTLWLIKDRDPVEPAWPHWSTVWSGLVDVTGRYRMVTAQVVTLDDMTARDYQDSHHLDLDRLSAE
jgi:hypothetical protein